jgi:hypothetical protein
LFFREEQVSRCRTAQICAIPAGSHDSASLMSIGAEQQVTNLVCSHAAQDHSEADFWICGRQTLNSPGKDIRVCAL